jgi:hypothetical protein
MEKIIDTIFEVKLGELSDLEPLTSTPVVVKISDGASFDSIGEEFKDAAEFNRLYNLSLTKVLYYLVLK